MKKLDIKSIAIIILGIALIISFLFKQKSSIDTHKDEINVLHNINDSLNKKNDTLKAFILILDKRIEEKMTLLEDNEIKLKESQDKIEKLKYEKNQIFTRINHMSANGIAKSFTEYLNERKGNNGSNR